MSHLANTALLQRPADSSQSRAAAPATSGNGRFFASQSFHFQTLRALTDIPAGGADTGEVFEAIKAIQDGDQLSWFAGWTALAERVLALAERTMDPVSKGGALMRAHTYFRTAEFFLPRDDPKRPVSWQKNTDCFYRALGALGVEHERLRAAYGDSQLNATYFPGPAGAGEKPLLMFVGGFDSTLEELYLMLVPAAHARGYSVLTYEGPGQGAALREQGLRFLPEWERPNTAVLEAFLSTHERPRQIVLIGMSMGGYLAPRAAAFEPRIDGVVAFDVCFDLGECAERIFAAAANPLAWQNPDFVWAVGNARWTFGTTDIDATKQAARAYTLAPVADRIRQHVLILEGQADHFIPQHQTRQFETALVNARSVTVRSFDRASGGAEHCQLGAITLVHAAIFDWLAATFA